MHVCEVVRKALQGEGPSQAVSREIDAHHSLRQVVQIYRAGKRILAETQMIHLLRQLRQIQRPGELVRVQVQPIKLGRECPRVQRALDRVLRGEETDKVREVTQSECAVQIVPRDIHSLCECAEKPKIDFPAGFELRVAVRCAFERFEAFRQGHVDVHLCEGHLRQVEHNERREGVVQAQRAVERVVVEVEPLEGVRQPLEAQRPGQRVPPQVEHLEHRRRVPEVEGAVEAPIVQHDDPETLRGAPQVDARHRVLRDVDLAERLWDIRKSDLASAAGVYRDNVLDVWRQAVEAHLAADAHAMQDEEAEAPRERLEVHRGVGFVGVDLECLRRVRQPPQGERAGYIRPADRHDVAVRIETDALPHLDGVEVAVVVVEGREALVCPGRDEALHERLLAHGGDVESAESGGVDEGEEHLKGRLCKFEREKGTEF